MTREPVRNADELDAEMRERLRAFLGMHRTTRVWGTVNEDEVVAFVKSELSRAGGERADAVEEQRLTAQAEEFRKLAESYLQQIHEVEAEVVNAREARRQLAAIEAARAKAMAQGSFWDQMCKVQFQGEGMIYRGTACAIARDADTIIASLQSELATLRADLAQLRAWKESAMQALTEWDQVRREVDADQKPRLGGSYPEAAAKLLRERGAEAVRLRDAIAAIENVVANPIDPAADRECIRGILADLDRKRGER